MASTVETTPAEVTSAPVPASPSQPVHPAIAAGARPVETVTEKPQTTVSAQASPDATAPTAPTAPGIEQTLPSAASPAAQPVTTGGATVQDPEQTGSFPQRLKEADRHWAWKVGSRTLQCILCLVGIACCAWLIGGTVSINGGNYYSPLSDLDIFMTTIATPLVSVPCTHVACQEPTQHFIP